MRLTFVNDFGQTFVVEIDPTMKLEDVMALLEAESDIPINEQSIHVDGRELSDRKATMRDLGVAENEVLLLRRKVVVAGRSAEQDPEMIRLQILGDPQMLRQLQQHQPDLAQAAVSNSARFAELLRQTNSRQGRVDREIQRLNADPYDVEAQRKIEEAIREQAVLENMEHALEYSPEFFGRVTMLYIPVEVNSRPVKAFVDSGAQQTLMSPECAEACGIMRLMDKRYAGIARGVGTARILGRVHSAQLKMADLYLPCSFTIMEGKDVDLLFGLDMLKAHQACIDLEKNVLRIQGREVSFLPEHELPENIKSDEELQAEAGPSNSGAGNPQSSFPGTGHSLQTPPNPSPAGRDTPSQPAAPEFPESAIQTLMGLGATRELAISTLSAAGGNLDVAASLLF